MYAARTSRFLAHYLAKCAAPVLKVNKLSREEGKFWGIEGYLPFEHAAFVKISNISLRLRKICRRLLFTVGNTRQSVRCASPFKFLVNSDH
jgi:hypothetical protein